VRLPLVECLILSRTRCATLQNKDRFLVLRGATQCGACCRGDSRLPRRKSPPPGESRGLRNPRTTCHYRCRNVALFLLGPCHYRDPVPKRRAFHIRARGGAVFQKLAAPDSELSYYDWPLDKQTVLACGDSTEINELPA
jgi:hypothetical protein